MMGEQYLNSVQQHFNDYKALGDKTLAQLNEEQLHWRQNEGSNSIAQIIQHMHGNMLSRWTNFLTEDGEKPWRRRDAEFEVRPAEKEALLQLWEEGWQAVLETLATLTPENLLQTITIRTKPLLVIDAINRQLAHYSYHVGQMVQVGKMLKGADWQSLSIAKGASEAYNEQLKASRH